MTGKVRSEGAGEGRGEERGDTCGEVRVSECYPKSVFACVLMV